MAGRWALAVCVTLLMPAAVGAQRAPLGQDGMSALGARAGSLAAQEPGVATRFWVGFMGGLPIDFSAPLSLGAVPLAAPAVAGAGLAWVSRGWRQSRPDRSVQAHPRGRGAQYWAVSMLNVDSSRRPSLRM